ncbi:MAG: phytoene/squalene synthase family protein [Rhodospirillales bacterium]|nr:phytoene/squalene synthase family protein [Rhodospirillales bacterium]
MLPRSLDRTAAAAADLAACEALLADGSRTFFLASRMLPQRVRAPAAALYAFCRIADDEVDIHGGRLSALARLRERLDRAYAGRPLDTPLDRALAAVVSEFVLPRALPDALIEGLEWDAQRRRYEDLSDLHGYAARVAGSVGAMMAWLMGVRDPAVVACACDLGAAMQFSNIARDVGEDARAGRLYLPQRWLREAGIDGEAWLAAPAPSEALGWVTQRLLRVADHLYRRADAGIAHLPPTCRPGIYAARLMYAEIGAEVTRLGGDALTQRAVVAHWRKAALLLRALGLTLVPPATLPGPALAEAGFLVDAIGTAAFAMRRSAPPSSAWPGWNFAERLIRVIELFENLERRERSGYIVFPGDAALSETEGCR